MENLTLRSSEGISEHVRNGLPEQKANREGKGVGERERAAERKNKRNKGKRATANTKAFLYHIMQETLNQTRETERATLT